jgi:hypothetical protein
MDKHLSIQYVDWVTHLNENARSVEGYDTRFVLGNPHKQLYSNKYIHRGYGRTRLSFAFFLICNLKD